jgi:hypothetical protein
MSWWRSRRIASLALAAVVLAGVAVGLRFYLRSGGKKVLAVGDSLTFQSSTPLHDDLGQHGLDVSVMAIGGSGLLDTKTNWPDRLRQAVASIDPDEVVVEFIGNYGLFGPRPGVADGSPQFYQQWAEEAQRLEDILTSRHAVVYWVVGPPVRSPSGNEKVVNLSHVYENLHAPGLLSSNPPTIDAFAPFSDSRGGYTDYGPATNGQIMRLRTPDGVHFTVAGTQLFARTISDAVVGGTKRHVALSG